MPRSIWISWWIWELFSKFYSFWPRNRNIHRCSIISDLPRIYQLCHVDVLRERMQAGVRRFPLHPALAVQKVMKYILVQVRPNPPMPNSFLLRSHPHREEWKVLHRVSIISEISSLWIHNETKATWPTTCSARSPEKCSLMPPNCESRRNLEPQESVLHTVTVTILRDILVQRRRDS